MLQLESFTSFFIQKRETFQAQVYAHTLALLLITLQIFLQRCPFHASSLVGVPEFKKYIFLPKANS